MYSDQTICKAGVTSVQSQCKASVTSVKAGSSDYEDHKIKTGCLLLTVAKITNAILLLPEFAFKTKLNKLLFYADFLHFKKTCFSISGLTYLAIQKGPVPKNYDWIFDNTMEKKLVRVLLHDDGDYMGEQFVATEESAFDEELFTSSELKAMQMVAEAFKKDTVNKIVSKSYEEDAWADNVNAFNVISYDYGFNLKYPVNGN